MACSIEAFEAVFHEQAIFAAKGDDVGDCPDGCQSDRAHQKRPHMRRRLLAVSQSLADAPGELEGHADAAQIAERIARARQSRMHEARCVRKCGSNLMMVGDHQFEAQFAGQSSLGDAANSAVDADQQPLRIFGVQLPDRVAVEAVALFEPRGNVEIDTAAGELDAVPQQGGRGDAVDVVVAVDRDAPLRADRRDHAIGRIADSGQELGIVQPGEPGIEELVRPSRRDRGRSALVPRAERR